MRIINFFPHLVCTILNFYYTSFKYVFEENVNYKLYRKTGNNLDSIVSFLSEQYSS